MKKLLVILAVVLTVCCFIQAANTNSSVTANLNNAAVQVQKDATQQQVLNAQTFKLSITQVDATKSFAAVQVQNAFYCQESSVNIAAIAKYKADYAQDQNNAQKYYNAYSDNVASYSQQIAQLNSVYVDMNTQVALQKSENMAVIYTDATIAQQSASKTWMGSYIVCC